MRPLFHSLCSVFAPENKVKRSIQGPGAAPSPKPGVCTVGDAAMRNTVKQVLALTHCQSTFLCQIFRAWSQKPSTTPPLLFFIFPAHVPPCRAPDVYRKAANDTSSDIYKMSAFAEQPVQCEMRPGSTKLQLIDVPFHSSATL